MLTGKQKRYLRAYANKENAIFQIGKDGLNANTITGINQALEARELVKISVLKTCETPSNELIIELLAETHSELVQEIGKTIIIYRRSKEHLIPLP